MNLSDEGRLWNKVSNAFVTLGKWFYEIKIHPEKA